jgi:hypothetical protein
MVAGAYNYYAFIIGAVDILFPVFGSGAFYLHFILTLEEG